MLRPSGGRENDRAIPPGAPRGRETSRWRPSAATPGRPDAGGDIALGIPKLDEEHAVQLQLLRAAREMVSRSKPEMAITLLDQLADFTVGHFQAEEQMMKETEYPGLEEHRNEHQLFLGQVQDLRTAISDSGVAMATITPRTLESWLIRHIQTADRTFASYHTGRRA